MNTSIRKGHFGWTAETTIDLPNNRVLTITTMKRSGGSLMTTASVGTRSDGFISHMMYRDMNKVVASSNPARVTEKVVLAQHNSVEIEEIKQDAIAFYSKEDISIL